MSENTKLWDILGRTDPAHTKGFTRGGGFKGTAIKPIWSYKRMTEEFGPCGVGWGVGEPSFQVVNGSESEVLVYCTVGVWYIQEEKRSETVYGVGGDKVVAKFSSGIKSDDEAFKKAFTDAVTNALKLIGVGADVHMGLFDDSKYVASMREEFADEPASKAGNVVDHPKRQLGYSADGNRTAHSLRKEGAWDALVGELRKDLVDCRTVLQVGKLREDYRAKARELKWPTNWLFELSALFEEHEAEIRKNLADEDDDFPGQDALIKLRAGMGVE